MQTCNHPHKNYVRSSLHTYTPWGLARKEQLWNIGVFEFETASHGGFFLQQDFNERVSKFLIEGSANPALCRSGWFEKDVDWALVVHTHPGVFDPALVKQARILLFNHNANFKAALEHLLENDLLIPRELLQLL